MYYCNPINLSYRYQYNQKGDGFVRNREAADPSLILFKGKYFLFPSMSRAFWSSEDLVHWNIHELQDLPVYDYAPDVRVIGEYLYFSASKDGEICDFYRTKDPETGEFEKIPGSFPFWDPNLFCDDDGRVYFYWGCSNMTPIYGVELDPDTMLPMGEKKALIENHKKQIGYERPGENHTYDITQSSIWQMFRKTFAESAGLNPDDITDLTPFIEAMPEENRQIVEGLLSDNPYIEGAWMTKHDGKYYLQYAAPGTEYNVYADGVYVGETPLGPFTLAGNNPYSYQPGSFFPGAGHGSTLEDMSGNYWHTSTMRISMNHAMERRVGLWPAGFDLDGELFCNQRYGDWPRKITGNAEDPWKNPEWMLLSYGKKTAASSGQDTAGRIVDENVQTWWKAKSNLPGEWISIDLGMEAKVHAVQINFADESEVMDLPAGKEAYRQDEQRPGRYIEETIYPTRWKLEGSLDGSDWFIIEDKSDVVTDLPHDLVVSENGVKARFVRLTVLAVPYDTAPCVSGLRVFGQMDQQLPAAASDVKAVRTSGMDMTVSWKVASTGALVLWGHEPDKLYHSYLLYNADQVEIGALVEETKEYYVRVDVFNEGGITEGQVIRVS